MSATDTLIAQQHLSDKRPSSGSDGSGPHERLFYPWENGVEEKPRDVFTGKLEKVKKK